MARGPALRSPDPDFNSFHEEPLCAFLALGVFRMLLFLGETYADLLRHLTRTIFHCKPSKCLWDHQMFFLNVLKELSHPVRCLCL